MRKLDAREELYLKRYKLGVMTKEQFKIYYDKGLIKKDFYDYIMVYKLD